MALVRASYRRNFIFHSRSTTPLVKIGEYLFPRKEYFGPDKEKLYNLSPFADGRYNVTFVKDDVIVADMAEAQKRIFHDRVVIAPSSPLQIPVVGTKHKTLDSFPPHISAAQTTSVVSRPTVLLQPARGFYDFPLLLESNEKNLSVMAPRVVLFPCLGDPTAHPAVPF
eukprot:gb/GEZJ01006599.1/.p1 GENE.gb/GEZJ01006599.1/~~gb/GEZJ01006599.1/.p1  ORF type:complete len:168 (-),score=6.83 gb/GEZJ01006599.1/:2103-2606(-)